MNWIGSAWRYRPRTRNHLRQPTLAASSAVLAIGIALGALAAFASLRAHGRPLPQTAN